MADERLQGQYGTARWEGDAALAIFTSAGVDRSWLKDFTPTLTVEKNHPRETGVNRVGQAMNWIKIGLGPVEVRILFHWGMRVVPRVFVVKTQNKFAPLSYPVSLLHSRDSQDLPLEKLFEDAFNMAEALPTEVLELGEEIDGVPGVTFLPSPTPQAHVDLVRKLAPNLPFQFHLPNATNVDQTRILGWNTDIHSMIQNLGAYFIFQNAMAEAPTEKTDLDNTMHRYAEWAWNLMVHRNKEIATDLRNNPHEQPYGYALFLDTVIEALAWAERENKPMRERAMLRDMGDDVATALRDHCAWILETDLAKQVVLNREYQQLAWPLAKLAEYYRFTEHGTGLKEAQVLGRKVMTLLDEEAKRIVDEAEGETAAREALARASLVLPDHPLSDADLTSYGFLPLGASELILAGQVLTQAEYDQLRVRRGYSHPFVGNVVALPQDAYQAWRVNPLNDPSSLQAVRDFPQAGRIQGANMLWLEALEGAAASDPQASTARSDIEKTADGIVAWYGNDYPHYEGFWGGEHWLLQAGLRGATARSGLARPPMRALQLEEHDYEVVKQGLSWLLDQNFWAGDELVAALQMEPSDQRPSDFFVGSTDELTSVLNEMGYEVDENNVQAMETALGRSGLAPEVARFVIQHVLGCGEENDLAQLAEITQVDFENPWKVQPKDIQLPWNPGRSISGALPRVLELSLKAAI